LQQKINAYNGEENIGAMTPFVNLYSVEYAKKIFIVIVKDVYQKLTKDVPMVFVSILRATQHVKFVVMVNVTVPATMEVVHLVQLALTDSNVMANAVLTDIVV
jgi:hypothetical protein